MLSMSCLDCRLLGQNIAEPCVSFRAERRDNPVDLVPHAPLVGARLVATCEDRLEVQRHRAMPGQERDGDLRQRVFQFPRMVLELLSTVHWVSKREGAADADRAIKEVYAWSARKQMFREQHIRLAWQVLEGAGWLSRPRAGLP